MAYLGKIRVDAKGAFRFENVREGNYLLMCSAEGLAVSFDNHKRISVGPQSEYRVDFRLEEEVFLTIEVLNEKAEPIPRAFVIVVPEGVEAPGFGGLTNPEGRFRSEGLVRGSFKVMVSRRDYLGLTVSGVRPSREPVRLVLDAGASIKGTVSSQEGEAVEEFKLIFTPTTGNNKPFNRSCTAVDGHFEIRGIQPGEYLIGIELPDNRSFKSATQIQLDQSLEVLLLVHFDQGTLTIRTNQ